MDPNGQAAFRSCSAAQAATTALVVATRAAVDRCGPGHVPAPQRQKTARAGEWVRDALHGEVPEQPTLQPELFQLFEEESGGSRPPCLGEPRGAQVEQMADVCPFVQILDAPVPQLGNQLLEVFRLLDSEVPEQVIDVPKISQDRIQQRLVDRDLRHSQMAEQLVEVPTVLSHASLQQQIAEQIVNQFRVVVGLRRSRSSRFSPRTEFNSAGF